MAELPGNRVYQGFWTDHSSGPILGATITTTSSVGTLVIALISLLVGFTGSHLWEIVAFVSYCAGVSDAPRSVTHHQRQVLLRNITSPGSYLLEISRLVWAWRGNATWKSQLPVAVLALICSGGFLIAGVFVSGVVTTSGFQVLVSSGSCGWLPWHDPTSEPQRVYVQLALSLAETYARTCYNKSDHLPQCSIYVQQAIPTQQVSHTECPFKGMCSNNSALRLDTGLLDSNDVFGINTGPQYRVQMRKVVNCSPLNLDRYFSSKPMPPDHLTHYEGGREALPGEQLYEWGIGQVPTRPQAYTSTFWQSNYTSMFTNVYSLTPRSFYTKATANSTEVWHRSTLIPIEELQRKDADIHIIAFQGDGVRFYSETDDPLFSAHKRKYVMFDDGSNRTMFTGDKPATFLSCAEQAQFCFSQGGCTPLLGMDPAYEIARKMAPTPHQNSILDLLFFQSATMYDATQAPSLVTGSAVTFQNGVPSDQWESEVKWWWNYLLAVLQTTVTHHAIGPDIIRADLEPLADRQKWPSLCNSQRMGAPDGFSNINVLGLFMILLFSGLIVLTNLTLVPVLKYLRTAGHISSPRIQSWIQNGVLQLNRRAYQDAGYSKWTSLESDVPIFEGDQAIPALIDILPRAEQTMEEIMQQ